MKDYLPSHLGGSFSFGKQTNLKSCRISLPSKACRKGQNVKMALLQSLVRIANDWRFGDFAQRPVNGKE
jgi:hypothetical protein